MSRTLLALALVASAVAAAENPETLVEKSQTKARAVIDRAVEAIGGVEALNAIESVRLRLHGKTYPRLQMTTPEPPYDPGAFDETLTFDLRGNRLLLEQRARGAGFEGHNRTVIAGGEGKTFDLRARTVTPIPAVQTTGQQFIQYYRRLPNLILLQALANPNSLRWLGEDQFDGRKHQVVTFVMPDTQQVALYVDAESGLLSKYELVLTDPLAGEDVSEIIYADYAAAGDLQAPRKWLWRVAGDVQARYDVVAEFNPKLPDETFTVSAEGFREVPNQPPALEARVEKLGEGVWLIHNVAGPNYNTLAVEFAEYVLAVEAPGTSAGADAVIERIKNTIPGKPIRWVATTHHHGDHIGGLRSFIAEGATVVTTPGNRKVVEAMVGAPQKDRLARSPRKAEIAFVEKGRRVFTDGKQTVELIDVGPNPHAREMVIAWLPKQRIVFQGDLFFLPPNGGAFGPPQAGTLSFARKLEELDLDVERIASVHGDVATIDDLRRAIAAGGVTAAVE